MKCFQRNNVKEKSRGQELTRTGVARNMAKESGRGIKKGGETGTEQCMKSSESSRKEMEQDREESRSSRKEEKYWKN